MAICKIEGCKKGEYYKKSVCQMHYARFKRHGTYDQRPNLEQRFWKKVHKTDSCWLWTGAKFKSGYGQIDDKGKTLRAHRVSYELRYGVTPGDFHVLHSCDNPPCVNPSHLFLGTVKDNMRDCISKNRHPWQKTGKVPLFL